MSSLLEISNKMALIFSVDGAVWSKSRYFSYSVHGASDIDPSIHHLTDMRAACVSNIYTAIVCVLRVHNV